MSTKVVDRMKKNTKLPFQFYFVFTLLSFINSTIKNQFDRIIIYNHNHIYISVINNIITVAE